MTPEESVIASLQTKLEAFESGLTEQEHRAFLAVVVLASAELLADPEVTGFQAAGLPGLPDPSSSLGAVAAQPFTSVSNVLKLRHDTAKNSISNVR